jgi:hypothetical protein
LLQLGFVIFCNDNYAVDIIVAIDKVFVIVVGIVTPHDNCSIGIICFAFILTTGISLLINVRQSFAPTVSFVVVSAGD